MEETHVQLDCIINLNDAESDVALQRALSSGLLEHVVSRTLKAVHIQQPVTLSLLITDDAEIQMLNKQYRQQDKPTDVLSFPLLDEPLVGAPADQLWQTQEETGDVGELQGKGAHQAVITPEEMPTNMGD